jgi:putative hydrolase of the HAD superfamily
MPPTSVHAVLFDYGLVLSGPPDPAAKQRMKTLLAAQDDPFRTAYWRSRHAYDLGDLNSDAYWHTVATDLGRTLTPEQLTSLKSADVDLWTQPNVAMIDWAAELQRAGILTGILSNIGDAMEQGVMARFPWMAAFNHHTFSHRLRIAKPDLEIYHHAAKGLGVPPTQILFIDDRAENIAAAETVGMHAIQYTDHPSFIAAMQQQGLEHLLSPSPQKT